MKTWFLRIDVLSNISHNKTGAKHRLGRHEVHMHHLFRRLSRRFSFVTKKKSPIMQSENKWLFDFRHKPFFLNIKWYLLLF